MRVANVIANVVEVSISASQPSLSTCLRLARNRARERNKSADPAGRARASSVTSATPVSLVLVRAISTVESSKIALRRQQKSKRPALGKPIYLPLGIQGRLEELNAK